MLGMELFFVFCFLLMKLQPWRVQNWEENQPRLDLGRLRTGNGHDSLGLGWLDFGAEGIRYYHDDFFFFF